MLSMYTRVFVFHCGAVRARQNLVDLFHTCVQKFGPLLLKRKQTNKQTNKHPNTSICITVLDPPGFSLQ